MTAAPPRHLLLAGLARNCARTLASDLERLRAAAHGVAGVERVDVVVVESDSTDATPTLLAQWAQADPHLHVISLGALRQRHPLRTDRIAQCRNAYLEWLETQPALATVDHVIVADLDGMCADLTPAALQACWALPVPWDACMANQGDYYYDVWALRHPVWCPGDAWADQRALLPLLGETEANNVALFSRMVHIPADAAPIEVESAFGGLAVYRREALAGLRYVGLDAVGAEVCEHVALHQAMRQAGRRLYIHPGLINARKTKHAGRKKFWRTLRRQLWNALRGRPSR